MSSAFHDSDELRVAETASSHVVVDNEVVFRLGTHNGSMHTDEILFIAIMIMSLRFRFGESVKYEIIRTRNPKLLATCHYVGDVGGIYCHPKGIYDHHQLGGAGSRNGFPYAASGLGWKHYGEDCVRHLINQMSGVPSSESAITEIADLVDRNLIQFVDGIDNKVIRTMPAKHRVSSQTIYPNLLQSVFAAFNEQTPGKSADDRFHEAVKVMLVYLRAAIKQAYDTVEAIPGVFRIAHRSAQRSGSLYLELDVASKGANAVLDEELKKYPGYYLLIFRALVGDDEPEQWRVRSVRGALSPDGSPFSLPENWWGLEGNAFAQATGVEEAKFCAGNEGWIAGAYSLEAARELAELALRAAGIYPFNGSNPEQSYLAKSA